MAIAPPPRSRHIAGLPSSSSTVSAGAPIATSSRSRLGPPSAVVAVARTGLVPTARVAGTDTVCQVSQLPVGAKETPAATSAPLAVVAVARTLLVPAASVTVAVTICQVVHAPVPGNARPAAVVVPLTAMSIGRLVVVPLAYRNRSVTGPACAALTVNST